MIIYRFRVTSEDQEDFLREIEIQPSQSFLDFHDMILSSTDLENCDDAFFYITDSHFKKKQEISYRKNQKQIKKYDDEMDEIVLENYIPHFMEFSKMKDFVEDPHQRMLYEYTGRAKFTFFIELFRIYKTEELVSLPRCITIKGELPKKVTIIPEATSNEAEPLAPASILGLASIFAGLTEDDAELEEIENNIEEIFEVEDIDEAQVRERGEMEENEQEDEEQMESLDEYDDMKDTDRRNRNSGSESDDF